MEMMEGNMATNIATDKATEQVTNKATEMAANTTTDMTAVAMNKNREETEHTKRMKANFPFFGQATFLYAVFYTFCMYKNGSGITFPFFVAGSLLFLCLCLSKLEISLKKGSSFYMVSMMLLAVSTFCTDDARIINLNKTGIFLLMMSLLLNQFYDTSKWKLGKYLGSICRMIFLSLGEIGRPYRDGADYYRGKGNQKNRKLWYGLLGIVIALPLLLVVLMLLSSADAVFRELTNQLMDAVRVDNILNVAFRICFMYGASYLLVAFLCKHTIREEVGNKKKGEPALAITIAGMLTVIYLIFSAIQIVYLFMGQMQLPEGYTYAMYAREGFFQLLGVSILNLIIVLAGMAYFKDSNLLKIILTFMSLCTFIMIVSSALRMLIYISYYYLTFLRIFVLWSLAVLLLLFVGVVIGIYRESFPLFRYSVAVVTVLYLLLSFSHPDYLIARVNVSNAIEDQSASGEQGGFFKGEGFHDYYFLSGLSADAAPVLIPYMETLGYDMEQYYVDGEWSLDYARIPFDDGKNTFGIYYWNLLHARTDNMSWRTFNVSRYMAMQLR